MKLYPAIDIRDGNCVRLYQGDYAQETVYGNDPVAQAAAFVAEGAEIIHMVDLDAAKSGIQSNLDVISNVCDALDVPVQVGGGVRTVDSANALFDAGVSRVVIGTAALENPELVTTLTSMGRSVAVGLDARGEKVATHGWTQDSGRTVFDLAAEFESAGVEALVVTEIGRDGTLEGPDSEGLSKLLATTTIPVIASGGVGVLADITALAEVEVEGRRFEGAIVGRALYEGKFTVSDALAALSSGGAA